MHPIVQEAGVWWLALGPARAEPKAECPDLTSVFEVFIPAFGESNIGSSACCVNGHSYASYLRVVALGVLDEVMVGTLAFRKHGGTDSFPVPSVAIHIPCDPGA